MRFFYISLFVVISALSLLPLGVEGQVNAVQSQTDEQFLDSVLERALENVRLKFISERSLISASPMAVDIERLEKEKNALKELYDSTIGNGWKNETNWDFSTPVTNDWYGITVDNNGYVISIILVDNNLDGHIPTEIGDFSSLGLLALNKNRKLRGVIPEPIGLLSQLTYLGIYECGLSGPLPDVFDGLSNINDGVFLFDNDINGVIPESFSSLKKCQVLRLEENELEGEISSAIGDMDNLQYLYLFENNLSGVLPNNLGQLTHLVSLKLSENSFGGNIPDFIYNLGSLSNLHLDHNRFDGNISNRLSELTNLTELKLSHNRFTGGIPTSLSALPSIYRIELDSNYLEGVVPGEFSESTSLSILFLRYNKFTFTDFVSKGLNNLFSFQYAPQDSVDIQKEITVIIGQPVTLLANIDMGAVPACQYRWNKDGIPLTEFGESNFEYTISYFTGEDEGNYYYEIRNEDAPDLTLTSRLQKVSNQCVDVEYGFTHQQVSCTNSFNIIDPELVCEVQSYFWDFGDGVSSLERDPSHIYDIPGVYSVSLTIEYQCDPLCGVKTQIIEKEIEVLDLIPYINYNFTQTPFVCTNYFSITPENVTCEELTIAWDFGDGGTSDERNPTHNYTAAGTYPVELTIKYQCDPDCGIQTATVNKQIIVPELSLDLVETNIEVPSQQIGQVLSASASTFADTWPIMHKDPLLEDKSAYGNGTMGVWRNNASYVYNIDRSLTSPVNIRDDGTFDLNTFNWEYAHLDAVPNWLKVNTITNYSEYSFELENQDILGNYTSAIYGYDGQLPAATGQNMQLEEMAYTGFEDIDGKSAGNWRLVEDTQPLVKLYEVYNANGALAVIKADMASLGTDNSWNMFGQFFYGFFIKVGANVIMNNEIICMKPFEENPDWTVVLFEQNLTPGPWFGLIWNVYGEETPERPDLDNTVSHSGDFSMKVTANKTHEQDQLRLIPGKEYLISCWVSVNDQHLTEPVLAENIGLSVTTKDEVDAIISTYDFSPEGPVIEGWQKLTGSFLYPLAAAKFDLTLKPGSKGTAWYDDLRLHPLDGNMQTYVYEPETLRLKAVLDENNYASLYYYDQEGKLRIVKKETEKGIKTISESADHLVEYHE